MFRSLMTIIRELYLYLTKVIFMLKHSVKLCRYIYYVMWQHVVERRSTTCCHIKYTGCPRRNVPDFGRVFLMLKYTDITQNTYVQS